MSEQAFLQHPFRIWAALLTLTVAYSFYLLPFTVFDGFTTFSNDAGSYVLTARKWSPFFNPTEAEQFTQPLVTHPPGFPIFLALTGASESLWASHLAVSVCLLLSLVLFGYYASLHLGGRVAILLLVTLGSLPGMLMNTLGILSENLYLLLSLGALTLYVSIKRRLDVSWVSFAGLFFLLTAAVFTRTVGIALLAAFVIAPVFDRELVRNKRLVFILLALGSFLSWQLWEFFRPDTSPVKYGLLLSVGAYDFERSLWEVLLALQQLVTDNLFDLLRAWSQYFSLNLGSAISFVLTYVVLIGTLVGLGLRFAKLRLDAVYSAAYISIVLLWPTELEELRLLHPVVPLLILQPFLYLAEAGYLHGKRLVAVLMGGIMSVVILHAFMVHLRVVEMRAEARVATPPVEHSREYYFSTGGGRNEKLAKSYAATSLLMRGVPQYVSERSRVAAVRHEHFAILADRPAITLSNVVSDHQQLCNLKLMDVEYVLASNLVFFLNAQGRRIRNQYENVAPETRRLVIEDGEYEAFLLTVDRDLVETKLRESDFVCESTRYLR